MPSSRNPAAHASRGSWRATASTIRCSRCCSAALPEAAPALAPVVAESAEAPAIAVGLAPACAATAPDAPRSTDETSGPPAAGDDAGEGATDAPETGAPEIGPAGTDGIDGDATTGGRRSDPYAGSGPAGMAGLLTMGAAGVDHELLVMTAGAAGATAPLVDGAEDAGGAVSAGALAATKAAPAGTLGATWGVAWAGCAAPESSPWIGPPANGGPPPAPNCPGCIAVGDPPIPDGIPCPKPAGGEFPQAPDCIPGDIGAPPVGICMPCDTWAGCPPGTEPPGNSTPCPCTPLTAGAAGDEPGCPAPLTD